MQRTHFLQKLLGISLLPTAARVHPSPSDLSAEARRVRQELLAAWAMSEKMTLTTAGQMPDAFYEFRYTPDAMTFGGQWRHCCVFTTSQLANHFALKDPFDLTTPPKPTKSQVLSDLKTLYQFVRTTIEALPDANLFEPIDFAGETVPGWRLFYILENHIIHHRGQCVCYLRLKGVTPEGYYGW